MPEERIVTTIEIEAFPVTDEKGLRSEVKAGQDWFRKLDLDDDRQAAMAAIMGDVLRRMAEDVASWLPDAAVARSESTIGVFIMWKFGFLDEEVLRQRGRAEETYANRIANLQRLVEDDRDSGT